MANLPWSLFRLVVGSFIYCQEDVTFFFIRNGPYLQERGDIRSRSQIEVYIQVAVVHLTFDAEEAAPLVTDLLLDAAR